MNDWQGSPLCLHASGTPQEYVQAAVRAGLREYGISDHAPMPGEPFDDWRMKQADMPAYLDWLTEARECAAPHGLTVRSALECDWAMFRKRFQYCSHASSTSVRCQKSILWGLSNSSFSPR